ncbi:MEKHLA domain-containing protein [Crocosphaera sp. XPORK-15E]|uniref:MEKHLA domain-containing protein n=1 Tax=Crocosphaera sp. XPORK-15E TaxID=3110247 RepID=UPI002B1EAFF4|nr:MEKHLA domain-containing protein [Crocosphaera sp. XPORK-15E]MEA5532887.1 MEKHLA domain-containing protein [Crocosphaera sp. XPORK-15E]
MNNLPYQQEKVIQRTQLILSSFEHWLGHSLWKEKGLPEIQGSSEEIAQQLFGVPFAVASHGIETDPIFNYGNQKALDIWELTWEEFIKIPSRKTAELVEQTERDRLLAETTKKGFSYFSGIRITSTGKRFKINNGIVWNVIDEQQINQGQAAVYSDFYFL